MRTEATRPTLYALTAAAVAAVLCAPSPAAAQGAVTGSGSSAIFFGGSPGVGLSDMDRRFGRLTRGGTGQRRMDRPERVPINPGTIADGTANTLRPPPERPKRRPRFGPPVAGPLVQYVFPTRVVAVPYPVPEARPEPEPRRRLGRVPETGGQAPDGVARDRAARDRTAPLDPSGAGASGDGADDAAAGDARASAPAYRPPRVHPPASPVSDAPLPLEACAEVRITTAGGIEWRQRVALADLGAASPEEVAILLQDTLRLGDPLSLEGPDGSFTVPAHLVRSLIVGPCRR